MKSAVYFTPHHPIAALNSPAYKGDAGLDVTVIQDVLLRPMVVEKVSIGLRVAVPEHLAFTFLTRSGSVAAGVFVLPTLIDSGYRGPLYLFVLNLSGEPIELVAGTSIAQLMLLSNHANDIELIESTELPNSERGTKSFNSSGGGLS